MPKFARVTIQTNPRLSENSVVLGTELSQHFSEGQRIRLALGKSNLLATVRAAKKPGKRLTLTLNPATARKLYLGDGQSYGFQIIAEGLRIGPVVGIMAQLMSQPGKPFGGQTLFFRQLLAAAREIGIMAFVFTPGAINWKKHTISGHSCGDSGWKRGTFPLPDVIYPRDRAYSVGKLATRRRLQELGIKFLNPPLVGKWETFKILSHNPALVAHIPDTRLIKSFKQVDGMINKYQAVYLKPVAGTKGRNIIKVVKNRKSSTYQYQYHLNNQTIKGTAASLEQLRHNLQPIMGGRAYIIQKQINLIKAEGNIIDVRILVQKDHLGQWGVTGMACRVGKSGAITSNISSGGSGRKLDSVLRRTFNDQEQILEIEKTLNSVALMAASTLEKSIGGCGEMGIDLGIDRDGRVWFIETNLRPARQVFNLIGEADTRMRSVQMPLLYSRYLAGFREGDRYE